MENARKLLDNGWSVLLFRDGLGQYSALAFGAADSPDEAMRAWKEHDPDVPLAESVFDGPNRRCGCGWSVADALDAVTEKVLFRRLPAK